jgi:hypothetical protein
MKNILLFIFLFIQTQVSFSQESEFEPEFYTKLIVESGKIIREKQCSRSVPKNMRKFWVVSDNDIRKLHKHLYGITELRAELCCETNGIIENLDNYVFQYIGVTIKRKKYIYINAFHKMELKDERIKSFWREKPVNACDGGNHFWGVIFNLETLKFEQLAINGRV